MKDKICLICHTAIDTDKEFAEFKHHKNQNEVKSRAWYHIECFKNRMLGSQAQVAVAQKAMGILEKVGYKIDGS